MAKRAQPFAEASDAEASRRRHATAVPNTASPESVALAGGETPNDAAAGGGDGQSATKERTSEGVEFNRLYRNWLSARAVLVDLELPDDDEAVALRDAAVQEAERELMFTEPPLPWMVWRKFEVLEGCIADENRDGLYNNHRTVLYLADQPVKPFGREPQP